MKKQLLEFFTNVLGLEAVASSDAVGSPEPIYAFTFANGASLSVEFTKDALSDQQAHQTLGLSQAVLAYREEYLVERSFGRLKAKPRPMCPYTPTFTGQ